MGGGGGGGGCLVEAMYSVMMVILRACWGRTRMKRSNRSSWELGVFFWIWGVCMGFFSGQKACRKKLRTIIRRNKGGQGMGGFCGETVELNMLQRKHRNFIVQTPTP